MHLFLWFPRKWPCLFCRTSENYVLYYYVKPYTRYGPFLIGILTGIYLTTKKNPLLKQWVRAFWQVSIPDRGLVFSENLKTAYAFWFIAEPEFEHLPPHLCAYHVCCFSGRQHLVGSVVCHFWLFWLDCPTSWRRRQPIHLCHMPCIKGCIDHSGHWLWPGLYWPVRRAMEVNQVLGWTKSHISTLTVITIYEST